MSPRTGRPALDDSVKRSIRLQIRMTENEHELLDTLSKRYGLSKTETIIKALALLAAKNK